ncbi:MAG: T9SS type A sorting domain-containing protein, partial [Chlorobi bacterium]|nr:T9SS type A sorting domain-containing protein [Chlorobiota bacterium]
KGNAYILKTDSLGNQEWQLKLDGDYINGTALVCNTIDSCIVAASKFDTDSVFYNENKSNIRVTKIDYNGNIIWDKTYTKGKLNSGVTGISNDSDEGFIISGYIGETIYNVEPEVMAFMLKINNDGDSIWYRQYSIFDGYLSDNRLNYPIATFDGGYAAVGTGRPHPPDEGTTDAWILKVDSMGCVSFNDCWVGIDGNKNIDKDEISGIKVFPNPAETYFYIEFNTDESVAGDNICAVFNLYGSKIMEFIIKDNHQKVNCSSWKKGIYFIKLSRNGISAGSEKVLVK